MIILHAIECECQECLDKWEKLDKIYEQDNRNQSGTLTIQMRKYMDEELFQSALVPTPVKSEIIFQPEKNKWALKITGDGVVFNRECYPNSTPDDFAKCFIELLEKFYTVKFYKNECNKEVKKIG